LRLRFGGSSIGGTRVFGVLAMSLRVDAILWLQLAYSFVRLLGAPLGDPSAKLKQCSGVGRGAILLGSVLAVVAYMTVSEGGIENMAPTREPAE
jgi:uncharacterized membrane-anchored protein